MAKIVDGAYECTDKFACKDIAGAIIGIPIAVTVLAAATVLFMLLACLINNGTAIGDKAELEAEREVLQHEVYMYSKLGDIESKKQTMDEVKKFNSELAKNKVYEKNFWIGCFYANIYHDIDFIKFE